MAQPFYYAAAPLSMMLRLFFIFCALSSVPVWADPPKFSSGGVLIGIQYGPGYFSFDGPHLRSQVGDWADGYLADIRNTHTVGLRLGYNILGHVSIEANLVATGWNLADTSRGGGGILTGVLGWHPLQLIFMNKETRPVPIDASIFFGAGYGIVGQRFGMDGLVWQWGMTADFWFNRFIGLGIYVRGSFPRWGQMYDDYNNRSVAVHTRLLPNTSGGMFWNPGLELLLRFGE